jgi:hypothetical protein
MTESEPEVDVVFRIWPKREGGDVIALMPYEPHNDRFCTSYQHVGQHGGAYYAGVIRDTKPATPDEYAPLLRELRQIGYRVRVIKRATRRTR